MSTAAPARLHLVRHALVDPAFHGVHYGVMDVGLCAASRAAQAPLYAALARRLPRRAHWVVTPLARTRQTAEAIFAAGYPATSLAVEPGLLEQDIGSWHGLPHDDLPTLLRRPPHPFWPMAADEIPPGGESMTMVNQRVGAALERLAAAHAGGDVVIVTHGGAIRAAVAHVLAIAPADALRMVVDNLSLTEFERHEQAWRLLRLNETPAPIADASA
jgi:alpha-ribazole phosphatase